jgi:hypothetical protein
VAPHVSVIILKSILGNEICDFAIRNVKGEDGQPLYDFDKDYSNISLETWETDDYQL